MNDSLEESRKYWDSRAATFSKQCGGGKSTRNHYAERFLELAEVPADATVLDMGCATGTLAVPLAKAGCEVIACDFSPKMLERLQETVEQENLSVDCKLMAWQDDWANFGLTENSVDVALASRSLGFCNVDQSLRKLDHVARSKVALTVSAKTVPAFDAHLMEYLGRTVPKNHEVPDIIEMLYAMDRTPTLTYIPCERPMRFNDWETAHMELSRLAGREPLDEREQELFETYARQHFKEEHTDCGTVYQLDYTLIATWAFIEWSTRGNL